MKKWTRKILVAMILALSLTTVMPAFTANAAVTEANCLTTTGWTLTKNNTCTFTKTKEQSIKCPPGLAEKGSTDTLVVCTEATASTSVVGSNKEVQDQISTLISIQGFLNRLLWPVLVMIGGLLDNSLLFGAGMEERLREIWVPIRNIVNILFVLALLGIALYNVLGVGDENGSYSIKSILPQIIIGIIVVNFSFVGIKVFLDGVNVLTTSIFALPGQVSEGLDRVIDTNSEYDKKIIERFCANLQGQKINDVSSGTALEAEVEEIIIKSLTINSKLANLGIKSTDNIQTINEKISKLSPADQEKLNKQINSHKEGYICTGLELSKTGELFLKRWNSRNAALAMALNMSKIVFYEEIDPSVKNIEKLAVNVIFSMMLYLIYTASFVALFVVLLGRLVVLWLSIALSPILLLGIAVPAIKEKVSLFGTFTEKFMKNAIAPIGIALSMTVGWIMLKAIQDINDIGETSQVFTATQGIPVVGLGTIQDLIVALGTVGVVWLGVFTAAEGTVAEGVTNFMKDGLTRVGKFVATTPLRHTAIMPIKLAGEDEPYQATGGEVLEVLNRIGSRSEARNQGLGNKIFGEKAGGKLSELGNSKTADAALATIAGNMNKITNGNSEAVKAFEKLLKNGKVMRQLKRKHGKVADDIQKYVDNKNNRRALKDIGREMVGRKSVLAAKAKTTPGTTPATVQVEAKPITLKTTIGSQSLNDHIKTDTTKRTTVVTALGATTEKLKTELKKAAPSKSVLRPLLEKMNFTNDANQKVNFSTDQLKTALGGTDYTALVKAFTSEKKVEDALK